MAPKITTPRSLRPLVRQVIFAYAIAQNFLPAIFHRRDCFLKNNEFSIFNISLNSVNQTKNATSANKSKTMGANEVIEFFKDFLLQRNIIDSKKILIDLSTQAVTKTINFYQKKYDINLERKFIKKALNRWIANEFQNFAKSKGIKVNNKVIPFIYYLKSNI